MSEFTGSTGPEGSAPSGFSFENMHRNAMIEQMQQQQASASNAGAHGPAASASAGSSPGYLPMATKTGTTIVGLVYKDGVVLGADTRATGDTTVVDKNCEKIHKIADNICCCGAGTAADTQQVTGESAGTLSFFPRCDIQCSPLSAATLSQCR